MRLLPILILAATLVAQEPPPPAPAPAPKTAAEKVPQPPADPDPAAAFFAKGEIVHFDLALSAIGAEHRPGDDWSACIHDLARVSVERRTILLLKPLVNWKYALTTLQRMRRYAAELGFASCADEEAEVWRVFESQPDDLRAGMLARYAETSMGGFNLLEEIEYRFTPGQGLAQP